MNSLRRLPMEVRFWTIGLAMFCLLIGLTSPFLRASIESDLTQRVQERLAEHPERFRLVQVHSVDHLDIRLSGRIPAGNDPLKLKRFVEGVPGVGRVHVDDISVVPHEQFEADHRDLPFTNGLSAESRKS